MKTILYHGSANIIERPIYGAGKPYNDYGRGFYCTESLEMAKEWSVSPEHDGYANCYLLDIGDLNVLNLNDEKYCILHWLAMLLRHRIFTASSALAVEAKQYILDNFSIDCTDVDVIVGYRADDSYFSYAQDFINGTISYRQLKNAMHLGNLGLQTVLISEEAFNRIEYVGNEFASREGWLQSKERRDNTARRVYFDIERNARQRGDLYIATIIDEEMTAEDERLR